MNSTGNNIMDVLQAFGELEWGRWSLLPQKDEEWKHPPVTVWRFKERNSQLEQLIVDAVNSFQGNVEWEIIFSGKNWVIAPSKVRQFRETRGFKVDVEALAALAVEDPNLGEMANKELPQLAEHIKKVVEGKMS